MTTFAKFKFIFIVAIFGVFVLISCDARKQSKKVVKRSEDANDSLNLIPDSLIEFPFVSNEKSQERSIEKRAVKIVASTTQTIPTDLTNVTAPRRVIVKKKIIFRKVSPAESAKNARTNAALKPLPASATTPKPPDPSNKTTVAPEVVAKPKNVKVKKVYIAGRSAKVVVTKPPPMKKVKPKVRKVWVKPKKTRKARDVTNLNALALVQRQGRSHRMKRSEEFLPNLDKIVDLQKRQSAFNPQLMQSQGVVPTNGMYVPMAPAFDTRQNPWHFHIPVVSPIPNPPPQMQDMFHLANQYTPVDYSVFIEDHHIIPSPLYFSPELSRVKRTITAHNRKFIGSNAMAEAPAPLFRNKRSLKYNEANIQGRVTFSWIMQLHQLVMLSIHKSCKNIDTKLLEEYNQEMLTLFRSVDSLPYRLLLQMPLAVKDLKKCNPLPRIPVPQTKIQIFSNEVLDGIEQGEEVVRQKRGKREAYRRSRIIMQVELGFALIAEFECAGISYFMVQNILKRILEKAITGHRNYGEKFKEKSRDKIMAKLSLLKLHDQTEQCLKEQFYLMH